MESLQIFEGNKIVINNCKLDLNCSAVVPWTIGVTKSGNAMGHFVPGSKAYSNLKETLQLWRYR